MGPCLRASRCPTLAGSLADGNLDVLLMKENKQQWWKTVIKGDPRDQHPEGVSCCSGRAQALGIVMCNACMQLALPDRGGHVLAAGALQCCVGRADVQQLQVCWQAADLCSSLMGGQCTS